MRAIVGATVHRQHVSGVSPILRVDGSMGDGWCPAESGGAHPRACGLTLGIDAQTWGSVCAALALMRAPRRAAPARSSRSRLRDL
jgi:hypothetical protein